MGGTRYRYSSPLGDLLVAESSRGVSLVAFDSGDELEGAERAVAAPAVPTLRAMRQAVEEIDGYFRGERRSFDVPLDLSGASDYLKRVLVTLTRVPFGCVTTYGQLARLTQSSSRAVGQALARNPLAILIPCHRVVASDGSLGGFAGGIGRKRWLLAHEGQTGFAATRSRAAVVG